MPDRPLTIATYAAGASLAAITLVYVFGPTFFLDDDAANSSKSARKKGVVGLINPANDCFINSVLQVLAGLPQLRAYLIREVHRRNLDGSALYNDLSATSEEQRRNESAQKVPEWKTLSLQQGLVTAGLKDVLDALNERPIYRKTISAQPFIRCMQDAFRTRISRSQQDAQEFLQVVVERLEEEYNAGKKVRKYARQHGAIESIHITATTAEDGAMASTESNDRHDTIPAEVNEDDSEIENIFPLEGKLESQIECVHCHFRPKPSLSSFLTLTLSVPHETTSTTLNTCFDQVFKQEFIEDYKCDKCRLVHALEVNARQISSASAEDQAMLQSDRVKIEEALEADPEKPPEGVKLPSLATTPKRKISRHTRISTFPEVLALHLNRSVWNSSAASSKNTAKVSFPETLSLGGLLDRKTYRLLGVVTHKGGHNSGHYESFRRQVLIPPFSTPASMGTEGVYSIRNSPAPSPRISAVPSPQLTGKTLREPPLSTVESPTLSTSDSQFLSTPTSATTLSSSGSCALQPATTASDRRKQQPPIESVPALGLPTPPQTPNAQQLLHRPKVSLSEDAPRRMGSIRGLSRKNKPHDRWWRISDDKIKESKTNEVLGMQKEVYLLFYEMVPNEG